MDIWRVTGDLHYLVQGFTIMKLGNWGDGTEGGGNLGVIWKVEATGQEMVVSNTLEK